MQIPVKSYYANRSIFITGATGFLGTVLLQKLLRDCPEIQTIYVLIRSNVERKGRKEICPKDRLQKLLQSSIFQKLRQDTPQVLEKVVAISGDVALKDLGISDSDKNMLCENVSIIFHLAATININETLATAMNINVSGAQRVIELAKKMKLSSLVHVSTAYCNADLHTIKIQEVVYPSACDPKAFLETSAYLNQIGALDAITPKIVDRKQYTYIFSKNIAESLVEQEAVDGGLPVCIVRPSMVSPIYKDPIECAGWVDTLTGFAGYNYAVCHGLNYISLGKAGCLLDVMPVDYVANVMILAAWDLGTKVPEPITGVKVYNACMDQFNPISIGELGKLALKETKKSPFRIILRPVSVKLTESKFVFTLLNFIFVGLPCFFIDCLRYLQGQRPRLYHQYTNITNLMKMIVYFRTTTFHFSSNNVDDLRLKCLPGDKSTFDIDIRKMDWEKYFQTFLQGLRRYFDKDDDDDDSTMPTARQRAARVECKYWSVGIAAIFCFMSWLCLSCLFQ